MASSSKNATVVSMSEAPAPKTAHDSLYPPALIDFMMQRWKPASAKMPPSVKGLPHFQARRAALSAAFPGDVLIVPTGHEKVRANDTHYLFRPGSDFYYLTGNLEADGILLMVPRATGGHEHLLFVEPNPGRSDATFFTDRFKGELWVGPRLGVEQSAARFGVDRAVALSQFDDELKAARKTAQGTTRLLRGIDELLDESVESQKATDGELATFLSEQRLLKDNFEITALRRACESTKRGFEDIIRELRQVESERAVEGLFYTRARIEGNNVGYNVIAAAGAHACVLHWNRNDGRVKKGDLILIDAGVESNELYTADVTRTLPISGKFTRAQREIYELVLAAQEAGIAEVKPGNDFMAPNRAAMQVLAQGLVDLGILKMSAEEALQDDKMYYKRYTLHNVSHMLGLDVHDCAAARAQEYKYGKLKPGMVLTVEPGLYFQEDDLTVPSKYRGIGIRIEDDIVVTKRGREILSDLPREVQDIEQWMRRIWKRAKKK